MDSHENEEGHEYGGYYPPPAEDTWADVVADVASRPGASFAELLSWVLDLAESIDLFSEWERFRIQEAVAEHLSRLTGDEAEKLMGVLGHLFAIAHRRAPAGRKAPGANVRRTSPPGRPARRHPSTGAVQGSESARACPCTSEWSGRDASGGTAIWTALEGLWDGSDRSDKDSQNGAHSREVAPGLEEAAARMRSAMFR